MAPDFSAKTAVWASLRIFLAFSCLLAGAGLTHAQATFATEPVGAPPAEVPNALLGILESRGTRLVQVTNGIHTTLGEVWFSKGVATRPILRKHHDVAYGNLVPGTLLGVLHMPQPAEDFTHHRIQPGWFTLRYVRLPRKKHDDDDDAEEDDLEGEENQAQPRISRYRDFALLTSIVDDSRVDNSLDPSQLARLAEHGPKANDPLTFSLIPVNRLYKGFPSVVSNDQGFCTVQFKLQTSRSRELDLAILLVNPPNVSKDD